MEKQNKLRVFEGEQYKLKCLGLGEKGDGIFKKDKFVIIVPGTEPSKVYEIKVTKVTQKVAFGEIVE